MTLLVILWLKRKLAFKILNDLLKESIKTMPKNWKTTGLGIFAILATLAHVGTTLLSGQALDWTTTLAGLTAGWGLLHAADATK